MSDQHRKKNQGNARNNGRVGHIECRPSANRGEIHDSPFPQPVEQISGCTPGRGADRGVDNDL